MTLSSLSRASTVISIASPTFAVGGAMIVKWWILPHEAGTGSTANAMPDTLESPMSATMSREKRDVIEDIFQKIVTIFLREKS